MLAANWHDSPDEIGLLCEETTDTFLVLGCDSVTCRLYIDWTRRGP